MSFGGLTFAHPWALLGLIGAALGIWLLRRRRGALPRLVLPEAGVAKADHTIAMTAASTAERAILRCNSQLPQVIADAADRV